MHLNNFSFVWTIYLEIKEYASETICALLNDIILISEFETQHLHPFKKPYIS